MKEIKIHSNFKVFDSIDELPDQIKVLFNKAKLIRESAYSEYSKFSVGAAVLLENGEILCGSNQENASYPSGLCAERTALFYANSKYPKIKILQLPYESSIQEMAREFSKLDGYYIVGIGNMVGWGEQFIQDLKKYRA